MGLMNFIRQNLPESWEKAATEMRMKTELITRLHNVVPRAYKNKYHYKEGISYIRRVFNTKCDIIHLVDATDIDITKWNELSSKIKEYEAMSVEDLRKEEKALKSELFKLRFSLKTNGLDNPMKIKEVRKDIARVKTELRKREIEEVK